MVKEVLFWFMTFLVGYLIGRESVNNNKIADKLEE